MDLPVILHWIARLGITSTVAAAAGVAAFQFHRLHRDGPAALQAIEKEVQSRLWDANKLD